MTTSPLAQLTEQTAELLASIEALATIEALREAEASLTGKRSILSTLQKSLGALESGARKAAGAELQEARRVLLLRNARRASLEADRLDLGDVIVSDVRWPLSIGHPGLVALTQRELEDVFVGMGFTVADGPEVESDWFNFEALNIPPAHPARGLWDTFYVDLGEPETVVLRTHTSPTQIHLMEHAVSTNTLLIHSVMP